MRRFVKLSILVQFFILTIGVFAHQQTGRLEEITKQFQKDHEVTGVVVAAIQRDQNQSFQQIITLGTLSKKSPIPVNQYTEFRLGPLTQLFTSALLAYFVQEGRVNLADPVSQFLPQSTRVPSFKGQEITIGDLATHTSGLPDMPYTLSSRATFSVAQMYHFLGKYELTRMPGSQYEHSNLGYALLANLLTRISKKSFPDLLQQVLLRPLNLRDTVFTLDQEQRSRYAIGYEKGHGISPLNSEKIYSVFIGSGGLNSNAHDMLTYLSFHMGCEETSLNSILSIMRRTHHQFGSHATGLGWSIMQLPGIKGELFYNKGTLFGFSSYMGIAPDENIGVVVLTSQGDFEIASLGEELLRALK